MGLLQLGVELVYLGLEVLGEVGSLSLQGGGEQAVLNGELLRMEIQVLHLVGWEAVVEKHKYEPYADDAQGNFF